ncbi:MAG TPA: SpaA isopeptide-forming pilin-related protein [Longimicrobiales bacterium]|nr:SpaA isopeptide-forming pilin-related protein [Longimicrobiales bacterium]
MSALCLDDPAVDPAPRPAGFDTFVGEGIGRLNGVDGSLLRFTFVDAGEPGIGRDRARIEIWPTGADPSTAVPVLSVDGLLEEGNIQAHRGQQIPVGGKIRVQKTIQAFDGSEVPDAPLKGFVFEVLKSGTRNVVGSLVTDDQGSAESSLLPPGTYDVVETDSRGLVDVTGPTGSGDDLLVDAGQITELSWINKDTTQIRRGTLEITKTVLGPDSLPDPEADRSGFVFEVLVAGTQTVETTLVTDALGTASALLDVGSYDVTERPRSGFTDLTGSASAQIVADSATAVAWTNLQDTTTRRGTLEITKTVLGPDSLPDPEADRSGFVFDVLVAGTQTVETTLVTDAGGQASALLEVGSYDVTERPRRGFTDLTGSASAQIVADSATAVAWTNLEDTLQPPSSPIDVIKRVPPRPEGDILTLLVDTLTYTIEVWNRGGTNLFDVVVTDRLPPQTDVVTDSLPPQTRVDGQSRHTITFPAIDSILPGSSDTFHVKVEFGGGNRLYENVAVANACLVKGCLSVPERDQFPGDVVAIPASPAVSDYVFRAAHLLAPQASYGYDATVAAPDRTRTIRKVAVQTPPEVVSDTSRAFVDLQVCTACIQDTVYIRDTVTVTITHTNTILITDTDSVVLTSTVVSGPESVLVELPDTLIGFVNLQSVSPEIIQNLMPWWLLPLLLLLAAFSAGLGYLLPRVRVRSIGRSRRQEIPIPNKEET